MLLSCDINNDLMIYSNEKGEGKRMVNFMGTNKKQHFIWKTCKDFAFAHKKI